MHVWLLQRQTLEPHENCPDAYLGDESRITTTLGVFSSKDKALRFVTHGPERLRTAQLNAVRDVAGKQVVYSSYRGGGDDDDEYDDDDDDDYDDGMLGMHAPFEIEIRRLVLDLEDRFEERKAAAAVGFSAKMAAAAQGLRMADEEDGDSEEEEEVAEVQRDREKAGRGVAPFLPAGWVCEEHVTQKGLKYKRYKGPHGEKARSIKQAWSLHERAEPPGGAPAAAPWLYVASATFNTQTRIMCIVRPPCPN